MSVSDIFLIIEDTNHIFLYTGGKLIPGTIIDTLLLLGTVNI